jgi:hypothetical protein
MRNETIISMRFVRSKLRKREESSHNTHHNSESTQPTQIVSTVEPVGFRQSPSSVWHFPPLPPQPNLYIYNASSQVSCHLYLIIKFTNPNFLLDSHNIDFKKIINSMHVEK